MFDVARVVSPLAPLAWAKLTTARACNTSFRQPWHPLKALAPNSNPCRRRWRYLDLEISPWRLSQKRAARSSTQACAARAIKCWPIVDRNPQRSHTVSRCASTLVPKVRCAVPLLAARAVDGLRVNDEITLDPAPIHKDQVCRLPKRTARFCLPRHIRSFNSAQRTFRSLAC